MIMLVRILVAGVLAACPLTEWEQMILDQHNTWRAATSPPAKDMLKVRWDTNIEKNMAKWLSSCDPNWPHSDQDRDRKNVGGYEFLGENLAYCAGSSCPAKLADGTIGHVGQGWWDEKDDYDYANDRSTGGVTSHYTQMASSNIYAMGCAAQKCNSLGPYGWQGEWWWIGCQYGERGQGYWVGTKPYEQGSGGLIEPPASVFTKNPGLCKDGGAPPAPAPAVDECAANPCGNGQTCKDPDQQKEKDFMCTCDTDANVKQTGSPATCPSAPSPPAITATPYVPPGKTPSPPVTATPPRTPTATPKPQATMTPTAPVTGTVVSVTKGPFDKEEHRRTVARLTGRPVGTIDAREETLPDGSTKVTTTFTGEGGTAGAASLQDAVVRGSLNGMVLPAASNTGTPAPDSGSSTGWWVWVLVAAASAVACVGLVVFAVMRYRNPQSVCVNDFFDEPHSQEATAQPDSPSDFMSL